MDAARLLMPLECHRGAVSNTGLLANFVELRGNLGNFEEFLEKFCENLADILEKNWSIFR